MSLGRRIRQYFRGGDLEGFTPNPKVVGLNNTPLVISSPATDQVIKYNGSSWVNAAVPGGGSGTTDIGDARPQTAWGKVYINKQPDGGSGGWSTFGNGQTLGSEGSTTHQFDADGYWNVYQGSFGGGTKGRLFGGTNYTITRRDWKPIFETLIKTGASIADSRIWCGFFSATPFASDTPALHLIAFRYATGSDGTAFWRCVTDNGSGSPTVTTTSIAIAAATKYSLRFECSASDVKFYINDVLAATHTLTLPTGSQSMGFEMGVAPLADSKQFWINHVVIIQPR